MHIQYIENTNLAYCNGHKFRKDKKGYWLCTTLHKRLHIYVWEQHNGPVPQGYQVHHIDHNKDNNDIENLAIMTKSEHMKYHQLHLTEDQAAHREKMLREKSIPALLEYRKKNPLPREWHQQHYEEVKHLLHVERNCTCESCGKTYTTTVSGSRFCSNACKAAYRRKSGADNITLTCEYCGKQYERNKYSKSRFCSKACSNRGVPRLPQLKK